MKRLYFTEIGLAALLLSGCLRSSAPPKPPDDSAANVARAAVADYAHRLADSFADAAKQLESGALTTAAETNAKLQAANAEARQQAFRPLDRRLNDEIGGDQWDADHARRLFEQIARGLRASNKSPASPGAPRNVPRLPGEAGL